MEKKRIAIACQGGGTQTAFTAGVLTEWLEQRVQDRFEISGLSGTSGGAICATAAWYGLERERNGSAEPPYATLHEFWQSNAAQTPAEKLFAAVTGAYSWSTDRGLLPTLLTNPYRDDPAVQVMQAMFPRREFLDFRALLEKHIDFAELNALIRDDSPRLLLGAVNVLSGRFKAFDSRVPDEICVESLLATAAVPNLFKAVNVHGELYWDGLFSQNPPVSQFLKCEPGQRPNEIWVVLINPLEVQTEPKTTADIVDRRNELGGNISLYQEISFIELVNEWLETGCFRDEVAATMVPVKIRVIRMDPAISDELGHSSKLSRSDRLIRQLSEHGREQGRAFLDGLEDLRPPSSPRPQAAQHR